MTSGIKNKWYYAQLVRSINASSATRAIAHLYYLLAYFFIKQSFNKTFSQQEKIWIRNSFYSGNTVLGLSDIDLSLLITDKTNSHQLKKFLINIIELKKIFPFIGEINVLDTNSIKDFLPYCNSYEVNRDPDLKELSKSTQLSKDQAYTYILRCFSSDYHHLSLFPELRIKKWSKHLLEINKYTKFKIQKISHNTPLKILSSLYSNTIVDRVLSKLYYSKGPYDFNIKEIAVCFLLYPSTIYHINESKELTSELIKEITNLASSNNDLLFKNFFNQQSWEIWGLFTQINSQKLLNLEDHLKLMKSFTEIVAQIYSKPNNSRAIIHGFDLLLSYNKLVDLD
jgi:hypothetical protein